MMYNNIDKKRVFISYRRDYGIDVAGRVKDYFLSKGFSVFYDVTSMRLGEFDKQIVQHINTCDYFVLILSQNALDRCADERDWVRKEIECALKNENIKIIPLILPQFQFPDNLPDSLEKIRYCHGVEYNAVLFESVMNKLYDLIKNDGKEEQHTAEYELVDTLDELYSIAVKFKAALRYAVQDEIISTSSNLGHCIQRVYEYYEKNAYSNPKTSQYAFAICNQFNAFVPHYNSFVNSQDRMSKKTQKAARLAEKEFNNFTSLILKTLKILNN